MSWVLALIPVKQEVPATLSTTVGSVASSALQAAAAVKAVKSLSGAVCEAS